MLNPTGVTWRRVTSTRASGGAYVQEDTSRAEVKVTFRGTRTRRFSSTGIGFRFDRFVVV